MKIHVLTDEERERMLDGLFSQLKIPRWRPSRKELEAENARLREIAGTCKWKLEDDEGENLWKPSCSDELWHFIDVSSDPIENGMKYCPFCGHVLEIVIEPIQPEPQEYE